VSEIVKVETANVNFRSARFDHLFINMVPIIAIASVIFVLKYPQYFDEVLTLDIFLLGYHHVISTYTQLSKSNLTRSEFIFLIYILPPAMLVAVLLCAKTDYAWLIPTIYLYWQWWHYTRQSEGISKSIRFKTKSQESSSEVFSRFVFYMVPLLGILETSSRQHATFLHMPVETIPVPENVVNGLMLLGASVWFFWFSRIFIDYYRNKVTWQFLAYQLSHHAIYLTAYILIDDITVGWLAINIWHNFQYILFVWHVNVNKFSSGFNASQPILSWCSQLSAPRIFIYFSACLFATYIFYNGVDYGIALFNDYTVLPLVLVAYQTINFHHYVVDTLIWKIRKPALRESLGITS